MFRTRAFAIVFASLALGIGCRGDGDTTNVYQTAESPHVAAVYPSAGPVAGGQRVTISGSAFARGATVDVGGAPATGVAWISATELTAVTPAGTAGAVTVTVTNPDARAGAQGGAYTYGVPAPAIAGLTAAVGPPAGGTPVSVAGSGFQPGAIVSLGGASVPTTFVAGDTLTATTPPGTAGAVDVQVTNPDGQVAVQANGFTYDAPPTIAVPTAPLPVAVGDTLRFTVTATDPESHAVTLRLLNPASVMDCVPAMAAASPVVRAVSFTPQISDVGGRVFLFRADDAAVPGSFQVVALRVDVIGGAQPRTIVLADVTGDGVLDVLAGAQYADAGAVADTGKICVWAGATTPAGAPTAVLQVPGAAGSDRLGSVTGPGLQCVDVTGDGVLDVVAGASQADVGSTLNTGAIYVWAGGPGLAGTVSPTATLTVPGAVSGDNLGQVGSGTGIQLVDVTGDGTPDIVAGAYHADVGGTVNTGAVYVWAGGAGLSGAVAPTATLTVAGAVTNDYLGLIAGAQGMLCCDVTGDGTCDVVVGTQFADVGSTSNTGAIYVWAGGSGLSGAVTPTARLTVPGAAALDGLGAVGGGQGLWCCDVTGDGTLDIVAGAYEADVGGTADTGAVYVWAGGTGLSGGVSPTATLTVSGAAAADHLGYAGSGEGLQCCDVTGDGTLDVVVAAAAADVGATVDAGAIYVWAGGSGLTGSVGPTATLTVSGAAAYSYLGDLAGGGRGIQCWDVTGDGTRDIVAGARQADVGGTADTGAIYVWAGGSGLSGSVAPTATLSVPGAVAGDNLGNVAQGQGLQCQDVVGDGTLDIVAGATFADVGGTANTGAIYVWTGGSGLSGGVTPTATLTVPGAAIGDQLGNIGGGQGILCCRVTGNGACDIVAGTIAADVGGTVDAGAIYVWAGGSALSGNVSPTATLTVPGAAASDYLGSAGGGQGIWCADVSGEGTPDIVAGAAAADVGGTVDAGAVYVWAGGTGLSGAVAPTALLTRAGPVGADYLGGAGGQGLACGDVTGDGRLEILAGASAADVGGTADAGAVFLWVTGPGFSGGITPTVVLADPAAAPGDRLGQ